MGQVGARGSSLRYISYISYPMPSAPPQASFEPNFKACSHHWMSCRHRSTQTHTWSLLLRVLALSVNRGLHSAFLRHQTWGEGRKGDTTRLAGCGLQIVP
jgi:hypothetical protein